MRRKSAGVPPLLLLLALFPPIVRTASESAEFDFDGGGDEPPRPAEPSPSRPPPHVQQQQQRPHRRRQHQQHQQQQTQEQQKQQRRGEEEGEDGRALQKSADPADHYFCGRGFADAASSCEHPCPSGSFKDCPPGMLCYYDTPCDAREVYGYAKATPPPTIDANKWRSPSQAPWAADGPRLRYYCGSDWDDASNSCYVWCPDGDHEKCPYGQSCFSDTLCEAKIPSGNGLWYPPTATPYAADDRRLTFFCGNSWQHAGETCQTWCPDSDEEKCPYGQSCFSDTNCKKTPAPSNKPTTRAPTRKPTQRPTGPSQAPTLAPQPLLPDDPSNNMFCGNDWEQAGRSCSRESHCGENGASDCPGYQYCWHRVQCDVRDFIPFEEGGNIGRPTHQDIAEKMGLTWPSDDPADHNFCGQDFSSASRSCRRPCRDGLALSCDPGEFCHENTPCDYRVTPGYGITPPPTLRPTEPPIPYDSKENYNFCGSSWIQANTCRMQWCGDNNPCPKGQSCFADTGCNIQDRKPLPPPPPTITPSWSPVPYDHKSNYFFCGATYMEAVDQCSLETHCRSGLHSECGGLGVYCWPGVTCHLEDFVVPTPAETAAPTIDTPQPTKSPSDYVDPRYTRFCGTSWIDASASCRDGRRPRWCPRGTDEECRGEGVCWADTNCRIGEFTMPPTIRPTSNPTLPVTPAPTDSPLEYSDPVYTSFCGRSYLEAEANCSAETHCPSVQHSDCSPGQYCWTVIKLACNIHEIIGPTPPPTRRPSQSPTTKYKPTEAPSALPTEDPTQKPTGSPLPETDERNSFYCGLSWDDANLKCSINCPLMSGCPAGESCFSLTTCSKSPPVAEPTPQPTDTMSLSPTKMTSYPTQRPTPCPVVTDPPTAHPRSSPSMHPAEKNVPAFMINKPPTMGPAMSLKAAVQLAYFPLSETALPKTPIANAQQVQYIVRSVQSSLEESIFVIETRSGAVIPSSLYTYSGFLDSLSYYTQFGVNGNYFYLGEEQSASTLEIEYGVANIALFLAKMMDTVAYERCDPNLLSCGIPALERTLEERNIRVECSPHTSDDGLECPGEMGCVCVLGLMNHYVGVQSMSALSGGKYSRVDFCETNLLKSVCSRRIEGGSELRWITAMTHWVFFVQQYSYGGWTYLDELHAFVQGNMLDESFVGAVSDLSLLDTESRTREDPSKQRFIRNFFRAMTTLSKGMPQSITQPEAVGTARQSAPPSERTTPVRTLAPTPRLITSSPPRPIATPPRPLPTSPSNSPTGAAGSIPHFDPTHLLTYKPFSHTDPPTLSARDGKEDPYFAAADNSSPLSTPVDTATTPKNSQLLPSADESSSPTKSSNGVTAGEYDWLSFLSDKSSPPTALFTSTATESSQQSVSPPRDSPPPTTSDVAVTAKKGHPPWTFAGPSSSQPTARRQWEYRDEAWYRGFFSPGSGCARSYVSVDKRISVVGMTFYYFIL